MEIIGVSGVIASYERLIGKQGISSLKAVSYTHLDVYKRQALSARLASDGRDNEPAAG